MIIGSHPTGNANVREAMLGLLEAGLLSEFHTCLAPRRMDAWVRLLPASIREQVLRRELPETLRRVTRTHPWRELGRFAAPRLHLGRLTRHGDGPLSVDGVYRDLDTAVARRVARSRSIRGVYAYEDGAAATFAAARRLGLRCLYDLPIGHWKAARRIQEEEASLQPAWAATLVALQDDAAKLARKDEELELADHVFAASSFTRETLKGVVRPGVRVDVIPYGAPAMPVGVARIPRPPGAPLRVLFVGGLSQRKGLSYLFEAVRRAGSAVNLTVVGRKAGGACQALDAELCRCNYVPSAPHAEILRLMAAHDVFVFPSLFEGFGLVLLEAMACGLPIIATSHTAAPDLIVDGVQGHIVPIRDADRIAGHLQMLAGNPDMLAGMSWAAIERAAQIRWETYRTTLAERVRIAIGEGGRYD
jgi:glycosyltransferase involved in cell wall biosynthesis